MYPPSFYPLFFSSGNALRYGQATRVSMDVPAEWKESLEYLRNAIHRGAK